MRIQDSPGFRDIDKKRGKTSPVSKVVGSLFASEMSVQEDIASSYQSDIETLRAEIEKAGNAVMSDPIIPNFKKFRDLLSALAKRMNAEAYRLEKFGGTPQNPRYYETITIINREADELYRLIINENRDQMAITAKVIGIKGLVVDLVT